MHLLLNQKKIIFILDNVADTFVLGQGRENIPIHNSGRENVAGFDHEAATERNLPIVSEVTTVDILDGTSVLLIIHSGIFNHTANHSLLPVL
jgi:hypothetical protein